MHKYFNVTWGDEVTGNFKTFFINFNIFKITTNPINLC
jgi:hypothetical protein